MTKQETYDRVVNFLRQQGCQATDELGYCSLRTDDGRKCAVGCLISDEDYDEEFEGLALNLNYVGSNRSPDFLRLRDLLQDAGHDLRLLQELQQAHDMSDECGDESWLSVFERAVARIARAQGLVYSKPEIAPTGV